MTKPFGLSKKEKLKSRKQIETLFANGKSFVIFPLRVCYTFEASKDPLMQIGVTATKRHFKKAVDRNRIKRLLREVYRLQKGELLEGLKQSGRNGYAFFMYTGTAIVSFEELKTTMNLCLKRLQKASFSYENK